MDFSNQVILLGAVLLLLSIFASAASSRVGMPLLLAFLLLGMLAGEDGPGGIHFSNFQAAHLIGSLALAVILFDGGMRTRVETFRVALYPALSLATIGVALTSLVTGLFAAWVLGFGWMEGLLVGAIVGSTDAAAVFSLLRYQGMALKQRVGATLEIESGSNDPMAVLLTVLLIEALAAGQEGLGWNMLGEFLRQMGLGVAAGAAGGKAIAWVVNRLELEQGLYALLTVGGGVSLFAATSLAGGSGFLAIYLAGLVLGNSRVRATDSIRRIHDGLAWLSQIGMFLMLGLLVTPSALLPVAPQAMLIALVLMFVARPIAVWLCLLPYRFPLREQVYIAWVGLRGAVPIILATFPLLAGLEHAHAYFNVTFFVVLMSLVMQGWTLAPLAHRLGLEVPPSPEPMQRVEFSADGPVDVDLLGYRLAPGSSAVGQELGRLPLPENVFPATLIRAGRAIFLSGGIRLKAGDSLYLAAPREAEVLLNRLFASPSTGELSPGAFFGDFVLNGDADMAALALLYGFEPPPEAAGLRLSAYLDRAFRRRPVVGDRVVQGRVEFVVREMERGRITQVGMKLR
ncbi:MAG: potassium/proton antiporter [Sulfuricellaceae bacterium]